MLEPDITSLNWDSQFFGVEVGEVYLKQAGQLKGVLHQAISQKMKLLYVRSAVPLDNLVASTQFVGQRFAYVKTTVPCLIPERISTKIQEDKRPQLIALALELSRCSRFAQDGRIGPHVAQELYKQWLVNSLNGLTADALFASHDPNGNIEGFITLVKADDRAVIGLLGVSELHRREGVGTKLVHGALQWASSQELKTLEVNTYQFNKDACAFYRKMGFVLVKIEYFYHFWL